MSLLGFHVFTWAILPPAAASPWSSSPAGGWHPASSGVMATAPCSLTELTSGIAACALSPLRILTVQLPVFLLGYFPFSHSNFIHSTSSLCLGRMNTFLQGLYMYTSSAPLFPAISLTPAASCNLAPKLFSPSQETWNWLHQKKRNNIFDVFSSLWQVRWRRWWLIGAAHILVPVSAVFS